MHFLILFLVLICFWIFIQKWRKGDFGTVRQKHLLFWLIVAAVVFATLIGRSPVILGIIASALGVLKLFGLQLLKNFPLFSRVILSQTGNAGKGKHRFDSRYLVGVFSAAGRQFKVTVKEGPFKGQELSRLSDEQIQLLKEEIQSDSRSSYMLKAWLVMHRAGEHFSDQRGEQASQQSGELSSATLEMGVAEAREVLGLSEDASREDIKTAHRQLMQKLHPDKGGNAYLASFINKARDVLLEQQD